MQTSAHLISRLLEDEEDYDKDYDAAQSDASDAFVFPRYIFILGLQWTGGTYSRTYQTAEIYIDGKFIVKAGPSTSYGSDYEQSAARWLISAGYLPSFSGSLWRFCSEKGIVYNAVLKNVRKKSELK